MASNLLSHARVLAPIFQPDAERQDASSRPITVNPSTTSKDDIPDECVVPLDWDEHDLLNTLQTIDPSLGSDMQLSLYPACCGNSKTALLKTYTEYFGNLGNKTYYKTVIQNKKKVTLVIDRHFHYLTPLNTPGNVVADVIAVTGLAGHAFGSWRNSEAGNMWLKDFLPEDIKGIRIMTYGYNSSLTENVTDEFLDYRRRLSKNC
ncbi:hypothetical protein BDD12DRAFT_875508 [Trichophaea hybrida]|nr:hypothetical protein BDD12DRAFT_875508 [Trichophaea hybrida]